MRKKFLFSIILVIIIILIALLAPFIAPNDPYENNIGMRFQKNSSAYPLGTDELGRCVLSRLIYGTRSTMEIGIIVITISALLGVTMGCISGYFGGIVDKIALGIFDIFMAFPPFVYIMVLIGVLGNGKLNLIISMTVSTWVISTKMVRAKVRIEKNKDYVKSAKIYGSSNFFIIIRHILPNIILPLIIFFSLQMGDIILLISGFSFLGLGMPADVPEWGMMISTAKKTIYSRPQLMLYPGICIFLAVFAFNTLAESIREKFE